jgi:hypothetical protein
MKIYNEILAFDPTNHEALALRVQCFLNLGEYGEKDSHQQIEKGLKVAAEAVKISPRHADLFHSQGRLAIKQVETLAHSGKATDEILMPLLHLAEQAYATVDKLNPQDFRALEDFAWTLGTLGKVSRLHTSERLQLCR